MHCNVCKTKQNKTKFLIDFTQLTWMTHNNTERQIIEIFKDHGKDILAEGLEFHTY